MHRSHRVPSVRPGVLALLAAIACSVPMRSAAQEAAPLTMETVGTLPPVYLGECSGIAASRKHPGIFWTHNDSGDGPFLFAIRLNGQVVARYRLAGARAVDWEDLAIGPCPSDPGDCLYIADTGDNLQRRPQGVLFIAREPDALATSGVDDTVALASRSVSVLYQDGPQDVESLAVTPDGLVVLVTRGRSGTFKLYRLRPADGDSVGPLEPSEELGITAASAVGRLATGAAFSPSGEWLAVRTYTEILFFRWHDGSASFVPPACRLGLREPQGEGIDFLDENALILTSEARAGYAGPITLVTCARASP